CRFRQRLPARLPAALRHSRHMGRIFAQRRDLCRAADLALSATDLAPLPAAPGGTGGGCSGRPAARRPGCGARGSHPLNLDAPAIASYRTSMVERLVIARLGVRGEGVADTVAGARYVPLTLPGETVEIDAWPGHPDRGHLIRVDIASPDRIAPICPHFGACGGCALQHLAAARYRDWKRALVADALAPVRLDAPIGDLVDAHGEGRRRVVLHARRGQRDVLEVGFAALKAHHLVAIDRCPILAPGLDGAIETAWAIAEILGHMRKPLDIQMTATDAGVDVDVRGSGPLTAAAIAGLAGVAKRRRLARLTRHREIVAQRAAPTLQIGRARIALPPGAFLQATTASAKELPRLVTAH